MSMCNFRSNWTKSERAREKQQIREGESEEQLRASPHCVQSISIHDCDSINQINHLLIYYYCCYCFPQNKCWKGREREREWNRMKQAPIYNLFHFPKLMLYFHIYLMLWLTNVLKSHHLCEMKKSVRFCWTYVSCENYFTAAHLLWNSKPVYVDKWRSLHGYFLDE